MHSRRYSNLLSIFKGHACAASQRMVEYKFLGASTFIDSGNEEQPSTFSSNHVPFTLDQRRHSSHIVESDRVNKDSRYVKTFRDPRYSTIDDQDIAEFKKILGDTGVLTDAFELEAANRDWQRKYFGSSKVLLRPTTTQQVSEILKYCDRRKLAVVPQGGNTGLVGGSVPVFDEVIVSLGAMNKIISFDELNGILVCEAGCILENLDNHLAEKGCMMPLNFGAKGSCQIGGNISTNAGGIHLLRYGSLRANILGLEIVLANGEIMDSLRTLRKDNTGYDLKQLFIGAEGTLGVVTKVSILTPPRLSSKNVAFLSCKSYVDCQKVLKEAKSRLGEILSAFEFLDRQALDMVLNHSDKSRDPLPSSKYSFYLLIETTGSCQNHDREKLDGFLEACLENSLVADGVVAQDHQQFASFWQLREGVTEALSKAGAVYKYDLSIPVPHLYSLVEDLQKRLGDLAIAMGYGHLGDGNLHLNISAPHYDEKILSLIEPYVYEWTASHKGSVSAEHGLGFMKADAIYYSKSPELVQWMARFKQIFDCNGILNPYKVLPPLLLREASPLKHKTISS